MDLISFSSITLFLIIAFIAISKINEDLKARDKGGKHFNLILDSIRKNFHSSLVEPDFPFLKIKTESVYREITYSISVPTPTEKGYKNNYFLRFSATYPHNLGELKIEKTGLRNKIFIYLFRSCAKIDNKILNKTFFIHGPKKGGDYPNIFVRSPIVQNKLLRLASENVTQISISDGYVFLHFSPIPEVEKLTPNFFESILDTLIELSKVAPERFAMPVTYPGQKNFLNKEILNRKIG
jgi:hypothetical protein